MHAQIEKPPPSPRNFVSDLPEELESAVLRALAKSPDDRFATTAEFKVALEECELGTELDDHRRCRPDPPAPTAERANDHEGRGHARDDRRRDLRSLDDRSAASPP